MATRRERVILDLEDNLSSGMVKAAAATKLLDTELNRLSGRAVVTGRASGTASRDIDSIGTSSERAGREVDRLSGRMRIFADIAAVFGPSLVPLGAVGVPAVTGLAQQLGFAAIGMGSLVAASQGVGDALKAVNEAAIEPTAANLDKARQAMAEIGPEAQQFVQRFMELRPALLDIRDAAAAGWFPGLTDALGSIERVGPEVAALFEKIGSVGGNLVAEGAAAFAGSGWADFRSFVAAEAPQALDDLGRTLGNVAKGLAELWMAFGPLNSSFSSWMLNASRSFANWAEGLSQTEGFQEFVEYIRASGPKVADALASLANAVIQVVEAVAPLGGPSLQIIESFGKVLAAIADSDLGTPILAAVSALALLNRTLQVTAALQTRLTGSTALSGGLAAGGVLGASRAGTAGLKSTAADLRTVGANWRYLGTSAAFAEARQSKALVGMAKGAGVIGGLTIAATGAADGLGLSNTASLALMGTLAGPWGAAIGGGVGAVMDLSKALDVSTSSAESFNAALASGDVNQMLGEIAAVEKELASLGNISDLNGIGDFAKSAKISLQDAFANVGVGDFSDTTGDLERRKAVLEGQVEAAERAALAEAGFSDAVRKTGEDAGFTTSQLLGLADGTRQSSTEAWAAFDAQTRLGESLDALADAANKGKRGLDANTEGGRENRDVIAGLAADWEATNEAMKDAPADEVEAEYRKVRRALIQAAEKMTGSREEAVKLANQLSKPMSLVIKDKTREAVASAKAAIADLRRSIEGKPIIQTVEVRRKYGKNATVGEPGGLAGLFGGVNPADGGTIPWGGGRPIRSADGSTVPHGGAYYDRYPYLLAPGEEVISNRHGQADRHRGLLKAINAGMLADGGTSGLDGFGFLAAGGTASGKPGKRRKNEIQFLETPETSALIKSLNFDHLGRSIRKNINALEKSQEAIENEKSARESLSSALSSAVSDKITSDLFSATDVWSKGGTFEDVMAQLSGDIASGNALSANIAALQGKGLDGPALDALLAQGDSATIANFAALTAAQLDQYEQQYETRNALAAAVGQQASAAAGYTAQIVVLQAKVDQVVAEIRTLNGIQKAIEKDGPKKTGHEAAKAGNKGAGKGARNRRKG